MSSNCGSQRLASPPSNDLLRSPLKPSPLSRIPVLLAVVAFAAILGHFIHHFPPGFSAAATLLRDQFSIGWSQWRFPVHTAMALLTVAVMWFSAAGSGLALLAITGAEESLPSVWQRVAIGTLVGWTLLGLGALGLGLAGFCSRGALGGLLIAFALAAIWGWSGLVTAIFDSAGDISPSEMLSIPGGTAWIAAALYLIAIPYAATPAIESDELRYHLAAPEAYLEAGRIFYQPHQAFSNFPLLTEMLYMIAMALQGTEAARLVHLVFLETSAVFIALLAYLLIRLTPAARPLINSGAADSIAAMAGACFAAIPSALILSCWGFVDIASVAYFLGVIYLGALIVGPLRIPQPWLLGLFIGGAIGTKYSMIPLLAPIFGFLLLMALLLTRGRPRDIPALITYFIITGIIAALSAGPWLARNFVWTHNPVYPLAHGIFGGGEWGAENAGFWAAKNAEKGYRLNVFSDPFNRAMEFLISPVTTSLFPDSFENHFLGPLPLMAMSLALFGWVALMLRTRIVRDSPRLTRVLIWIGFAGTGAWGLWFATFQSSRLLLPAFALIFALGGWGGAVLAVSIFSGEAGRAATSALRALLLAAILYSCAYSGAIVFAAKAPLPVALGLEPRENYLDRSINYHAMARWLAPKLSDQSKALLIGEHRTLYFPNAIVVSDWFDTPQPLPWIRATKNNDELFALLAKEKVRYVFFNLDELRKYAARYFEPRFSKEEYRRFEQFMGDKRLHQIRKDDRRDIWIYELPSPAGGKE